MDGTGIPIVAEQVKNPASIHEDVGSISSLTQCVKDPSTSASWGIGRRCSSDPALLWLWHRPVALKSNK